MRVGQVRNKVYNYNIENSAPAKKNDRGRLFDTISKGVDSLVKTVKSTFKNFTNKLKDIFFGGKDSYSVYNKDYQAKNFVGSKDREAAVNFATQRLQGFKADELSGALAQTPAGKDSVYTVKKGDTLSEIAAKYGMSWKELAKYNNLDNPHLIFPGQEIKIPLKAKINPHTPPIPTSRPANLNTDNRTDAAQGANGVQPLTRRGGSTTERLVHSVVEMARRNNWDPEDLLTVMSYETAGTLDPWKRGPKTKWGRHYGLIQWGGPQRRKYGVYKGMPVEKQVEAVERYLKDHGVKPGDSILQIYAAINAGSAKRIYASDARNGGAPGTVLDKVRHQMHGHRRKARQLLAKYGYR